MASPWFDPPSPGPAARAARTSSNFSRKSGLRRLASATTSPQSSGRTMATVCALPTTSATSSTCADSYAGMNKAGTAGFSRTSLSSALKVLRATRRPTAFSLTGLTSTPVWRPCYAPNQAHEPHRAPSTLALCLRDAEWIPAKDGSLRRPSAITTPELAAGLSTGGNEDWLNAIGFASEHRQRSEQSQLRRKAAKSIGLPEELADQLASLSPEALKTLGGEMLQRIASGAFTSPRFPERDAPNPARRAEKLAERASAAPAKAYESRSRSVRTTDKEVRQLARPYLRDLYTNPDGEMICQACHLAMPFRLEDGTPYFEAPELFQSSSAELAENHLALCPTCCAKWQHANSTSDVEICDGIEVPSCRN
jgi:hypothetical protein